MNESPTNQRPVNTEEMATAFAGPAPAADRCFLTFGQASVRIAFAEQEPESATCHFRSAVTLSPGEAPALGQMLTQMIVPHPWRLRLRRPASRG